MHYSRLGSLGGGRRGREGIASFPDQLGNETGYVRQCWDMGLGHVYLLDTTERTLNRTSYAKFVYY